MGLVKAAMNAASGVMADQWKEFFYCDALPAEVLAVKGQKRTDRRSANKHGNENIISDGSAFRKSINNSLWMACPKMRLKPTSVKGLMNLAIFLAFDSNQGKVTKKN